MLSSRVYREYGSGRRVTGVVYFLGGGFLELPQSERRTGAQETAILSIQVSDVIVEVPADHPLRRRVT